MARQRPDVRLATGTALFAGNQDGREIPCYRIAGYPVQHLSRIRRCTRQTPEHGPPATRETGDTTAPQEMIAALAPRLTRIAGFASHPVRVSRTRPVESLVQPGARPLRLAMPGSVRSPHGL